MQIAPAAISAPNMISADGRQSVRAARAPISTKCSPTTTTTYTMVG